MSQIIILLIIAIAWLYLDYISASKKSLSNIAMLYEKDKQEILTNSKSHWLYKSLEEAKNKDIEQLMNSQKLFINR